MIFCMHERCYAMVWILHKRHVVHVISWTITNTCIRWIRLSICFVCVKGSPFLLDNIVHSQSCPQFHCWRLWHWSLLPGAVGHSHWKACDIWWFGCVVNPWCNPDSHGLPHTWWWKQLCVLSICAVILHVCYFFITFFVSSEYYI